MGTVISRIHAGVGKVKEFGGTMAVNMRHRLGARQPAQSRVGPQAELPEAGAAGALSGLTSIEPAAIIPPGDIFNEENFLYASVNADGIGSLYFNKGRIRLQQSEGMEPAVYTFRQVGRFYIPSDTDGMLDEINAYMNELVRGGVDNTNSVPEIVENTNSVPEIVDRPNLVTDIVNKFEQKFNLIRPGVQGQDGPGFIVEVAIPQGDNSLAMQVSRGNSKSLVLEQYQIDELYNAAKSGNIDAVKKAVDTIPALRSGVGISGPSTQ